MATSPRDELRILTVTEFERSIHDNLWYWSTKAANGEIVGDSSEGYHNLRDAVNGFFAQQGYDPSLERDPAEQHYSKLVEITAGCEYHIRKYAYGAPDPYEVV